MQNQQIAQGDIAEIENLCKEDFNFLAALCMPEIFKFNFPEIYQYFFNLIKGAITIGTDKFPQYAVGLPRGHLKTTWIKIQILYFILFTNRQFILIVGSVADLAQEILSDVQDILDSENIKTIYGNWRQNLETDRLDLKKFHFRGRNIVLCSIGAGQNLRGKNIKNLRPDVIICDDMQSKEGAESITEAKKLFGWFQGTLKYLRSPSGCLYIYIGNMYRDIKIGGNNSNTYTCILRNLQKSRQWISLVVGGILSDGKALCEELVSLEQHMEDLTSNIDMETPEVFFAEVMNDPECGAGLNTFNPEYLQPIDINYDLDFCTGKYIIIDPSLGQKNSDEQSVGFYSVWSTGNVYCDELTIYQVDAPELVETLLKRAVAEGYNAIFSESAAYQATLLQWFTWFAAKLGITDFAFLPIPHGGVKKTTRILNSFKRIKAGGVRLQPRCYPKYLSQAMSYNPLKQNNMDDILDNVANAEFPYLHHPYEIRVRNILELTDERRSTDSLTISI